MRVSELLNFVLNFWVVHLLHPVLLMVRLQEHLERIASNLADMSPWTQG